MTVTRTTSSYSGEGTETWINITSGVTSGTATGGSTTTLVDTSKSWTTNQWAGRSVWIYGGTGIHQVRYILSNTSNTLTLDSNWPFTTAPSTDSTYRISHNFADIKSANDSGAWGNVTQLTGFEETGWSISGASLQVQNGGFLSSIDENIRIYGLGKYPISFIVLQGGTYIQGRAFVLSDGSEKGIDGGYLHASNSLRHVIFGYWRRGVSPWTSVTSRTIGNILLYGTRTDGVVGFTNENNLTANTETGDIYIAADVKTPSFFPAKTNTAAINKVIRLTSGTSNLSFNTQTYNSNPALQGFESIGISTNPNLFYTIRLQLFASPLNIADAIFEDFAILNSWQMKLLALPGQPISTFDCYFRNLKENSLTEIDNFYYEPASGTNQSGRMPDIIFETDWIPYVRISGSFLSGFNYSIRDKDSTLRHSGTVSTTATVAIEWQRYVAVDSTTSWTQSFRYPFSINIRQYGYFDQSYSRDFKTQLKYRDDSGSINYGEAFTAIVNPFVNTTTYSKSTAAAITGIVVSAGTITVSTSKTWGEFAHYLEWEATEVSYADSRVWNFLTGTRGSVDADLTFSGSSDIDNSGVVEMGSGTTVTLGTKSTYATLLNVPADGIVIANRDVDLSAWVFEAGATINADDNTGPYTVTVATDPGIVAGTGITVVAPAQQIILTGIPQVTNAIAAVIDLTTQAVTYPTIENGQAVVQTDAEKTYRFIVDAPGYLRQAVTLSGATPAFEFSPQNFRAIYEQGVNRNTSILFDYNTLAVTVTDVLPALSFADVFRTIEDYLATEQGILFNAPPYPIVIEVGTGVRQYLFFPQTNEQPNPVRVMPDPTNTIDPELTDFVMVLDGADNPFADLFDFSQAEGRVIRYQTDAVAAVVSVDGSGVGLSTADRAILQAILGLVA